MAIRRMRVTCWIREDTNTQSAHAILFAFPLQQWFAHERASSVTFYVPFVSGNVLQTSKCSISQIMQPQCCNGKAIPLQAWTGPEGSRRLSLQITRQLAHECGKVVSLTHRPPLPPGNTSGTHFC